MKRVSKYEIEDEYEHPCETCGESLKNIRMDIKVLTQEIAELKKLLKDFISKDNTAPESLQPYQHNSSDEICTDPFTSLFPLSSQDKIIEMEKKINSSNYHIYIDYIGRLMAGDVIKNLKYVITDDMVVEYNIDGTHGKRRLKDHKKFFRILMDAITRTKTTGTSEEALRKGMQFQKKRVFKRTSARKSLLKPIEHILT